MSMFGARFAVFVRRTRVLPGPCPATRNLCVLEVVGGIWFKKGIQGNCHLQHLTLRQAKGHGVVGRSSFTMEDVLVEQCCRHGVFAYGTGGVSRCTNVEVRQCGMSGVCASNGASITLIGAKTTVHHNCKDGNDGNYGLKVIDGAYTWYGLKEIHSPFSTIQLVSPLTKEQVAIDNGGGGNWGATHGANINQIKTIAATTSTFSVPCGENVVGQTQQVISSGRTCVIGFRFTTGDRGGRCGGDVNRFDLLDVSTM